ncbi:lectin-like domain-containing protein [Levilactobacillus humaensis]|uniref:lectin-like domain-containing protein n=1 Tax=Levilactobacillus humaensis TaxID=2950375 RepID=UPI0021C357A2|nr:hypothetical protein [Levilactobacillus humaensis]
MKIKSILLGMLAVVAGIVACSQALTVKAEDWSAVSSTAPKGIQIDNYFSKGTISPNSAAVVNTDQGDNQAVRLTEYHKSIGTIWSSDDAKMSLAKPETASMWMYFGNTSSGGDGMAFVMQNDDRGLGASATLPGTQTPAVGQTLGVWGVDDSIDETDPATVAKNAIQNSWALEFDTYANRLPQLSLGTDWDNYFNDSANLSTQFDEGQPDDQHIAANYPGQSSSYNLVKKTYSWLIFSQKSHYYATLNHPTSSYIGEGKSGLNGSSWRHLTMKWTPAPSGSSVGQMTYSFDDKDAATGKPKTGTTRTVDVETKNLGLGADKMIRWGFTSTTGTSYETNAVVFEQVPGLVDADASATLTDESQPDKQINDSSDTVNSGDRMSLNYNVKYTSGRESWKDIVAKLNLPSNIIYKSAKITYANGDTDTIDGLDTSNQNGQTLSKSLENLNTEQDGSTAPNGSANITLKGVAISGTSDATVAATNSTFNGSNAMATADVSGFTVKKAVGSMIMALTGDNIDAGGTTGSQTINAKKDITITGHIKYLTGTATANSQIRLHPQMNGVDLPTQMLSDSDPAGDFTYTIPVSSITNIFKGDNQFVMYATDNNGVVSNDVGYTVTLKDGTLALVANPSATFNVDHPKDLTGSAMTYAADSSWGVQVSDTRGTGSKWKLTATADPIISRLRGSLDGDLIYGQQSLTQGSATIDTHTTDSNNDQVNVTGDWNSDNGILLKANAGAVQGSYVTTVHWSLNDAPGN